MPPISLLIKPASGLCNMQCKYCFYADETDNREVKSYGIMSIDTLEAVIMRTLEYAERECTIAFQGGEPTLAGLDYYKKVIEFQNKYNNKKITIHNAIQTNGFVINEEWAKFFYDNNFLVGLSLDGPKDIHDYYRVDAVGKGTYQKVMHAAQLFDKHKVEYNILTVVNAKTAKNIRKIYGFFRKNHFTYQQYIPCLDPIGEERGQHEYSLTPEIYKEYLCDLFDCWYNDFISGKQIYNRYFYNLVNMLHGEPPESCGMMGFCGMQYVLEADGSVYPCDFYALDEWKLGNIVTDSFQNMNEKRKELNFIETSKYTDEDCKTCKWANLCRGGCRRDRDPMIEGHLSKNYFCKAYYDFFEYAVPRLRKI